MLITNSSNDEEDNFIEKSGMPNRVESFREGDHNKNRLRAQLEFVKPIRNDGEYTIQSKSDLARRENLVGL